jgi:glycosyltransferase involved in cell wall biosynthesis
MRGPTPTVRVRSADAAAVASQQSRVQRVLIVSHSHPQLTKGGAEIAAYELFQALQARTGYESWFLGHTRSEHEGRLGAAITQPFSQREYIYSGGAFDWFKFANTDSNFPREFRALLEELRPTIVHFHHYIGVGVEAFLHVRETLPNCRILVTLHEYLALCHHYGQMLTKQHRTLCYQSSPTRCNRCFNEYSPSDFFLRKLYIQRFFELVDHFIAPSAFLAERYVSWGVLEEKVSVIENVVAPVKTPVQAAGGERDLLRVAFFGQISALKGINVLLEAAEIMQQARVLSVVFEIHGDYSGQPAEFQADFLERLGKVGQNVKYYGPYELTRVDQLMQAVDLVVIPSIWWENSPIVIQEALRNRRPIICSDIGGMAEKVRDGVDGFHFPVGNSGGLATLLLRLVKNPAKVAQVSSTMRPAVAAAESIEQHLQLYAAVQSADPITRKAGLS